MQIKERTQQWKIYLKMPSIGKKRSKKNSSMQEMGGIHPEHPIILKSQIILRHANKFHFLAMHLQVLGRNNIIT